MVSGRQVSESLASTCIRSIHSFGRWRVVTQMDRARLQRGITAAAYAAFAGHLLGEGSIESVSEADYASMEEAARAAIRQRMAAGWTQMRPFLVARSAAGLHLLQRFPAAPLLQLQYADDEITSLIEEELGLLGPTLH